MSDLKPLYPVNRQHLEAMSDEVGIWQHATGATPNRAFGYCTDDVARALIVDLLQAHELGWQPVAASVRRALRFLLDAFDPITGRFRNLRGADGGWLEAMGSQDCHARALVALGRLISEAPDERLVSEASQLFCRALPAARALTALRPIAAAVIACDFALGADALGGGAGTAAAQIPADLARSAGRTLEALIARLRQAFERPVESLAWPWPETVLTYENGLAPLALIAAGRRLGDASLTMKGCLVLDWLARVQTTSDGSLSLIGNDGWWPRGGLRSQFDQQPIEATTIQLAAEAALRATGDASYRQLAEMAYGWFLGDNDLGVAVALPSTGACQDGLARAGVSANQGAESTLMWLTSLEQMRALRAFDSTSSASRGAIDGAPRLTAGSRR